MRQSQTIRRVPDFAMVPATRGWHFRPDDQYGDWRTVACNWAHLARALAACEAAGRTQGRWPGLSPEEQKALLNGLKNRRTPHLGTMIPLLLLTGMRAGEALSLTWSQIDLMDKTLRVGRAKTSNGTRRMIPINGHLTSVLTAHRSWFVEEFGEPLPGHHLFPWGKPVPSDPTRHATDITWGWDELRKDTGVSCRLHDLRHTFAAQLVENGISESTMLARWAI